MKRTESTVNSMQLNARVHCWNAVYVLPGKPEFSSLGRRSWLSLSFSRANYNSHCYLGLQIKFPIRDHGRRVLYSKRAPAPINLRVYGSVNVTLCLYWTKLRLTQMRTLPMTRLRTLNILIKVVNTSLPSTVVNLFNLWPMSSNGILSAYSLYCYVFLNGFCFS